MIALVILLAGQAAPQRWSVLADPCPRGSKGEVVVCAPGTLERLPLPDERGPPDHARRPTGDPRAALENSGTPCPPRGCMGSGIDLLAIGRAAVGEIGYATRRRHPGRRVPIVLD